MRLLGLVALGAGCGALVMRPQGRRVLAAASPASASARQRPAPLTAVGDDGGFHPKEEQEERGVMKPLGKAAAAAALAAALLVASPGLAAAKGGGRGSGYSSPSRSSYSSRSYSAPSRSYSTTRSYVPVPVPTPYYGGGGYTPFFGGGLFGAPRIYGGYSPGYYGGGYAPVPFFGGFGSFLFAAVTATALWSVVTDQITGPARGGGLMADVNDPDTAADFRRALDAQNRLVRDLRLEFAAYPTPPGSAPASGAYDGTATEADYADQDVATYLSFDGDGRVTGAGKDTLDGPYKITDGRWAGQRVAWTEVYDDGLRVLVDGTCRKNGNIDINFTSNRGVSGSATLSFGRR